MPKIPIPIAPMSTNMWSASKATTSERVTSQPASCTPRRTVTIPSETRRGRRLLRGGSRPWQPSGGHGRMSELEVTPAILTPRLHVVENGAEARLLGEGLELESIERVELPEPLGVGALEGVERLGAVALRERARELDLEERVRGRAPDRERSEEHT